MIPVDWGLLGPEQRRPDSSEIFSFSLGLVAVIDAKKNRTQAWMRFFRADESSPGGIRTCDQSINSRSLYR